MITNPENEKEKNQIIERNRQKREAEKSQLAISSNQNKGAGDINLNEVTKEINQETASTENPTSDKKDQATNKENQQNSLQKTDNKDNKNVYYGIGVISLIVLVISMVVVWVKKR